MKRSINRSPIILSLTLSLTFIWSCSDKGLFSSEDKGFEGKVTYKVEYDLPPERQQMAGMIPTKETVYIDGKKSRLEREISMGAQMILINDPEKDSMVMLMKAQGMGIEPSRIPMPRDTGTMDFQYEADSTRTILERKCKKAVLMQSMGGQKVESPVWYTESIQAVPFRQFKGLGGLPLRFQSKANGVKVVKEAKKIVEKELPDSLFNMHPKGYMTRSIEEFKQMMGRGNP